MRQGDPKVLSSRVHTTITITTTTTTIAPDVVT
jgi:hypothetical protein